MQGDQSLGEGALGGVQSDAGVFQAALVAVVLGVDEVGCCHGARRGAGQAGRLGRFVIIGVNVREEEGEVEGRAV